MTTFSRSAAAADSVEEELKEEQKREEQKREEQKREELRREKLRREKLRRELLEGDINYWSIFDHSNYRYKYISYFPYHI
jgi:hypothetical protein